MWSSRFIFLYGGWPSIRDRSWKLMDADRRPKYCSEYAWCNSEVIIYITKLSKGNQNKQLILRCTLQELLDALFLFMNVPLFSYQKILWSHKSLYKSSSVHYVITLIHMLKENGRFLIFTIKMFLITLQFIWAAYSFVILVHIMKTAVSVTYYIVYTKEEH